MKKIIFITSLFYFPFLSNAQNIGIGTVSPHNSAMLEINSSNKGLLPPRMNSSQRTSILSPAPGLIVYDTDTKNFWYFNGSNWLEITNNTSFNLPFSKTLVSPDTVFSINNSGTGASIAGNNTAVSGISSGIIGSNSSYSHGTGPANAVSGVLGIITPSLPGGFSAGVRGINNSISTLGIGVVGYQAGSGWGVYGETPSGTAVYGSTTANSGNGIGVKGETFSSNGIAVQAKYSGTGLSTALEINNGAIKIGGIYRAAFTHTATLLNKISSNGTDIDNPMCNGDPNAILFVTQKLNPQGIVYNNSPIGVYYNTVRNKWEIFNQDNSPIPTNALFNILVIKQ